MADDAVQRLLKTGRLYRAARPDKASREDRRRLGELGIRSIIDLRTKTEHIQQAQKQGPKTRKPAGFPVSDDETTLPLRIPGIQYFHVNFNGNAYSRHLISQLSWINTGKLIGLMALGYRTEAISILGENVMQKRGLVGLAIDSIDTCGEEVRQLFEVLREPSNYPIMVHCTQGKDRTGLTVQLALLLLHVPLEAIQHDYMLSQGELLPEREARLEEIRSIGLTEEFANCSPDMVSRVHQHIDEKYGSIEQYLARAGVSGEVQLEVRNILSA